MNTVSKVAIGIGVAGLLCCSGLGIAAVVAPSDAPTDHYAPVMSAPPTATIDPGARPSAKTTSKDTFKDGIHRVNVDINPGTYATTVPDSYGCYWSRVKDGSGEFTAIIANGANQKGEIVNVTIAATDWGFTAQGCGTWTKVTS